MSDSLNLIEIFLSVQGETSLTGLPTTFIRLARCNLRCSWCDTAYSFGRGTPYTLESILNQVDQFGAKNVCITGGEPLLQKNVYPLMTNLLNKGYDISLETSGSLCVKAVDPRVRLILDVKCPQSGMQDKNYWPNLEIVKKKDEVKFVIQDRSDYEYAKDVCQKHSLFDKSNVLFSPVFGKIDSKVLVSWFLEDKLPVRLNLQVHKYIWEPNQKGV